MNTWTHVTRDLFHEVCVIRGLFVFGRENCFPEVSPTMTDSKRDAWILLKFVRETGSRSPLCHPLYSSVASGASPPSRGHGFKPRWSISPEFFSLLYAIAKIALNFVNVIFLTKRFHVAVRLFSNRSQMTSKCGKNKKVAHEAQPSVSLMFLPHFDVLCDLLLNRRTATWNLFVLYNKKIKIHGKNALLFQISPLWQTRK